MDISLVILTKNEEIHIDRCLKSALRITSNVFVVDSFSVDKTVEFAKAYTDNIYQGDFKSFSEKLNWAILNLPITTPWTFRLDADEILTEELILNIREVLNSLPEEVTGIYLRRQLWFLNKWMKHGDMYPISHMRIWRTGYVSCEKRELDEHMILKQGISIKVDLDIIDNPKTSINTWIQKHNGYSDLEAKNIFNFKYLNDSSIKAKLFSKKQEETKRFIKDKIYNKMPLFIRPFIYFFYRYIFKFGFLDGKEGFIWNILHGFWYRFLIDIKVYELRKKNENHDNNSLLQ